MKKLPFRITVVFVKSRSVWKTIGLKPKIEDRSLHVLEDEISKLGYELDETDSANFATFTLGDTH